jgi:hypothetical protein
LNGDGCSASCAGGDGGGQLGWRYVDEFAGEIFEEDAGGIDGPKVGAEDYYEFAD